MYFLIHVVVLIFFPTLFGNTSGEDCPKVYLRYSKGHSYCLPPSKTCKISDRYLRQGDIEKILDLHNQKRNEIATGLQSLPKAANMLQMEWDDELAAVVQKYAEQCLFKHDCPDCRRVMNFGVGQNIAMQTYPGPLRDPDWKFAVNEWFQEIKFFPVGNICDFKEPGIFNTGEFRHFSQISWAETFRIGCGYVAFENGPLNVSMYFCNYGPQGNFREKCMYERGEPCSHCPQNTCCGTSCSGSIGKIYTGLCKRSNKKIPPSYPASKNALLYCDFHGSDDCFITGNPGWLSYSTLSGNFLEIVLEGGKKSTINFSKQLPADLDTFCINIKYRKGPAKDVDISTHSATGTISAVGEDYKVQWKLPDFLNEQRHQFGTMKMTAQILPGIGKTPVPKQVSLSFEVPLGQPPQFFNIKEITVISGVCYN